MHCRQSTFLEKCVGVTIGKGALICKFFKTDSIKSFNFFKLSPWAQREDGKFLYLKQI